MIICSCNVISDARIKAALTSEDYPKTPCEVYKCLGCNLNCGRCVSTVRVVINETLSVLSSVGSAEPEPQSAAV